MCCIIGTVGITINICIASVSTAIGVHNIAVSHTTGSIATVTIGVTIANVTMVVIIIIIISSSIIE